MNLVSRMKESLHLVISKTDYYRLIFLYGTFKASSLGFSLLSIPSPRPPLAFCGLSSTIRRIGAWHGSALLSLSFPTSFASTNYYTEVRNTQKNLQFIICRFSIDFFLPANPFNSHKKTTNFFLLRLSNNVKKYF